MLKRITPHVADGLKNQAFRKNAQVYLDIERDYRRQVEMLGLPFSKQRARGLDDAWLASMKERGLLVENGRKSLHTGWISPSCIQCRRGLNAVTLGISTQCPRNCYFCFNPNQAGYERLLNTTEDVNAQVDEYYNKGIELKHIALTGGEPLLHKPETIAFFEHSRARYPQSYLRLYTSGLFLDEACLQDLQRAGLDEIRFSVKLEDSDALRGHVLDLIRQSKAYIPYVMVEMPVAPDQVEPMKGLLRELDGIGISGINLLEFCYPLYNAREFAKRGYSIKNPPFDVLYDYEYGGGLPIAGSEEACLELLEFVLDEGISMGVHYCSLENKSTSQLYLENAPYVRQFPMHMLSDTDCFLKCAKAFGKDAKKVLSLAQSGMLEAQESRDRSYVEFRLRDAPKLKAVAPDMEIGVSYGVAQQTAGGAAYVRELKLALTTPATFNLMRDV